MPESCTSVSPDDSKNTFQRREQTEEQFIKEAMEGFKILEYYY